MPQREATQVRLLRVRDVATALNLGINRTYSLIADGQIQSVRIGKSIRVTEAAVSAFIASHESAVA